MGFRLGDIADHTDNGTLRGIQREIACECWFTSKGKTIPKIIKVMDEEGMLHTIREIQLLTSEEKSRHPDGRAFMQTKPGRKNGNREAGVYERKL